MLKKVYLFDGVNEGTLTGESENLLRSCIFVFRKLTPATKKCCGCIIAVAIVYAHWISEGRFSYRQFQFFNEEGLVQKRAAVGNWWKESGAREEVK